MELRKVDTYIREWTISDKYLCPGCRKKLTYKGKYTCKKCGIKLTLLMKF